MQDLVWYIVFYVIMNMLPGKLAFVDLETTGTSARFGRIIEIGIVRVEDGVITRTYQTLLNPQTHLPPEIEMLTGITQKDLEDKPTFREVKNDILDILVDSVFVAHNVRFDYSFLKHEFGREQIDFRSKHFCTVKLSRALYPHERHHNLDALIERFNLKCENRHRAYDDAFILWDFYQKARSETTEKAFFDALSIALRRPNIPTQLSEENLDALPERPGVYIFYGANPQINLGAQVNKNIDAKMELINNIQNQVSDQIPLYIGKSINIKDRVLSHFSSDLHSTKEMSIVSQIRSIETLPTAGELGALFLESQLIKKHLPIYNRLLRHKRELIGLTTDIDIKGYKTVKLETFNRIPVEKLDSFLGFFRSKKETKNFLSEINKQYVLCEKLLGLEKTTDACFGYRLGRCKGACIGKEPTLFYNLRFTTAFYKTKIKPWPYNGPIIITETNDITGQNEFFIIDKWCYLGSLKSDNENDIENITNLSLDYDYIFDLDMYKILFRFLNKKENYNKVKVLKENEINRYLNSNR